MAKIELDSGFANMRCRMELAEPADQVHGHATYTADAMKLEETNTAHSPQPTCGPPTLFVPNPSALDTEYKRNNAVPSQVDEATGLTAKARRLSCPVPHCYTHNHALPTERKSVHQQQQRLPSLAKTAPPPTAPAAESVELPMQQFQSALMQPNTVQGTQAAALQRNVSDSGVLRPFLMKSPITRKDLDGLEVLLGGGVSSPNWKGGMQRDVQGGSAAPHQPMTGQRARSSGHGNLPAAATYAVKAPFDAGDTEACYQALDNCMDASSLRRWVHNGGGDGGANPDGHEAGLRDVEEVLKSPLQGPRGHGRNAIEVTVAEESYCETPSTPTSGQPCLAQTRHLQDQILR
jgi:hypothetical protein